MVLISHSHSRRQQRIIGWTQFPVGDLDRHTHTGPQQDTLHQNSLSRSLLQRPSRQMRWAFFRVIQFLSQVLLSDLYDVLNFVNFQLATCPPYGDSVQSYRSMLIEEGYSRSLPRSMSDHFSTHSNCLGGVQIRRGYATKTITGEYSIHLIILNVISYFLLWFDCVHETLKALFTVSCILEIISLLSIIIEGVTKTNNLVQRL